LERKDKRIKNITVRSETRILKRLQVTLICLHTDYTAIFNMWPLTMCLFRESTKPEWMCKCAYTAVIQWFQCSTRQQPPQDYLCKSTSTGREGANNLRLSRAHLVTDRHSGLLCDRLEKRDYDSHNHENNIHLQSVF